MTASARIIIGISGEHDPEQLASAVGEVIDTSFESRESSHFGGEYYLADVERPETIRLFPNLDPLDGTAYYESREEFPFVLRLDATERDADELVAQLTQRLGEARRLR